ncbi:testis-specific serine/threonine-protein kinase 3-like [Asterias rubens]|uniref:testis-specific serine/threonine-protein kinase 3-like n=1 Tax=Asterias rubens TaxID=7604 RepID=UPI00145572B5|nr:testis-specific serine/threonine-protein kinase 3-like [Asterias rubens]
MSLSATTKWQSSYLRNEVMAKRGYFLGEKLGSGSYSKVRFAFIKESLHKVAIKIIDRRRAPSDYQRSFLPRELEIIKTLKHPNIIQTHDWFEESEKIYQIIELAECGDVLEYVRTKSRGSVGETLTRRWVLQTARAIAYMHGQGVAHRDVKCENLLLDSRKNIKLSDFGFVRRVGMGELSRTFCGSAAYAAPEIIRSFSYNPYMSDVWALGVVAFILATGYMPFGDDVRNVAKILESQQRGLRFPGHSRVHLSEECKGLIKAMLTLDVSLRKSIQCIVVHPWFTSLITTSTTQ